MHYHNLVDSYHPNVFKEVPWPLLHLMQLTDPLWGCSSLFVSELCNKYDGRFFVAQWRGLEGPCLEV